YLPAAAQAEPQAPVVETPPPAPIASAPNSVARPHALSDDALAKRLELQAIVAERPWGRDPFEGIDATSREIGAEKTPEPAIVATAPAAADCNIVGVSARNGDWIAIINTQVFRVGDTLPEGFVVRRITTNTVTLESKGWAYIYSLGAAEPTIARIDGGDE
ncbi:MAG: hypothetical protein KDA33_10020, partial [Phycisphaerales bacterium]|nr:hypothetical protein [Phycisphaerales bacterium]